MRRRPNYHAVRYYQHEIAGRIAVQIGVIDPIDSEAGKPCPVYDNGRGGIHYAVVGQDWLRILGMTATEL